MQFTATHHQRILAIDLRPKQFGYAVFEGPKRLLDMGGASYRPGGVVGAAAARRSIVRLASVFLPSVIVVKRIRQKISRNSPGVEPILRAIRSEAVSRSIPVCLITRKEIREVFSAFRSKNKYEIATMLVRIFPELLWKLPPERKFYESEHPGMSAFDAVALGYTFWHRANADIPAPE